MSVDDSGNNSTKQPGKKTAIINMFDDSNDDSSGGDDDDDVDAKAAKMEAIARSPRFKKKTAIAGGTTQTVMVAGPIKYRDVGYLWVFLLGYRVIPWYNNATFYKAFLEEMWDADHSDDPGKYPAWLSNISVHHLRDECNRSNELVLQQNGYPENRLGSTVVTRTDKQEDFLKQVAKLDKYRKDLYTTNSKEVQVGKWFLDFIKQNNKDGILKGMNRYIANTDAARIKQINGDFLQFGNIIHEYQFGYTLDHFWPDYSIKEFLKQWFKAYSFDDIEDQEVLKKCYLNYPAARQLPVWSDIVEKTMAGL